jgi:hypothetical protein
VFYPWLGNRVVRAPGAPDCTPVPGEVTRDSKAYLPLRVGLGEIIFVLPPSEDQWVPPLSQSEKLPVS